MKTKTQFWTALSIALAVSVAQAEYTIWTDANGRSIEAEHVKTINDKVLLRMSDGRELTVSLNSLSESDVQRAMVLQPPKLDIKVSAKNSRSNQSLREYGWASRHQIQEESICVNVELAKSGSTPYTALLKAELYVIGERDSGFIILDRTLSDFTYQGNDSKTHSFSSSKVELVKMEGGKHGAEYDGYLLVVKDISGNVIATKASKREYESRADAILLLDRGAKVDENYSVEEEMGGRRPRIAAKRPF